MSLAAALPRLPELQLVGVATEPAGLSHARMSYMEAGAAHPDAVILLHGIGSNSTGWRYVLDGLSSRHRVIAWNAPGYYLSADFSADAPSHAQYADALAALLDALDIESAFVAGSSFGSLVAASFAARHPARVRRLALLGASRGQRWRSVAERQQRLAAREESIRDGGIALAERRWQQLVAPDASEVTIALTKQVLAATNARGLMQSARATDQTDVLDFAHAIAAQTLLVVGSEDRVNPPQISVALQQALPAARLVQLEGVGHLAKLEAPAQVIDLLLAHFAAQPHPWQEHQ